MRVLYLSHNGLLDPLGQSQVLQYLVGLSARGHRITLITFEKGDEWSQVTHRESIQRLVADAGIRWVPLAYHRWPSGIAPAYDLIAGGAVSVYQAIRQRVEIVHARGYITALIAAVLKAMLGVRFIFDPRSFWPDERVEMGIWREGSLPHRLAKRLERWYLTTADAVVSLTESGVTAMQDYPYLKHRAQTFRVITTCTNLEMFRPDTERRLAVRQDAPFTLGYLGTVGTPYLLDEVLNALAVARTIKTDARLLILNRRDHSYITERAKRSGVPPDAIEVKALDHKGVAAEVRRMSAGVVFITPTPCRRSCAPTKVGELLASGVPCIANTGVGDLERILVGDRVGVTIPDFTAASLAAGLTELMALCAEPDISERCAASARRHFSLEDGVKAFDALYADVVAAT